MKLPRYLQIALLVTGALALYTLFSDESDELVIDSVIVREQPTISEEKNKEDPKRLKKRDDFVDLFPSAIKQQPKTVASEVTKPIATVTEIATPPLPFKVIGAWWSGGERALMLQDARRQWIVCHRCRATEPIWVGAQITPEWQLKGVSADSLTFMWLPQMRERHLALGDMNTEPTFN